jgi:oligosaccharide 4-alpha-D-glucosyltransferase
MRCLKPVPLIFFLAFSAPAIAQNKKTNSAYNHQGVWLFATYDNNIIKATFTPDNIKNYEQISNAVIAKPYKVYKKNAYPVSVTVKQNREISFKFPTYILSVLRYFDSGDFKGFHFTLGKGEKIFGSGERSLPLDRRGYKLNLYNNPNYAYGINESNLNYSVPFIISSKGYGIFFDNPSKGYLDIGKTNPDILAYGAYSGELTFYIIPGKNIDEIVRSYQALVGTQPIPARWVFGNLMSRFGYRSEKQLISIVDKMKAEKFPVDAVILDLFWFGDSIKGTLGNLDWVNKQAWPNPERMIMNLKMQNINTILITEPYILNTTPNFLPSKKYHAVDSAGKSFLLTDFYFGNGGLLDLFRKDAQDWFWSKYKPQIIKGVAGWWGDLGEPERHPKEIYHNLKDLGFKRLFKADEVHNIFGHYWDKMLFDKYAKEYPDVRLFNLNRSGFAGSARYGVFPWSGDVGRNWSGLQAQLPVMLGMSISGVPYIHADAGGFALGDGDPELYLRWIQFATFTPIFRPHGTALGDLAPEVKDIPSEAALYDEPYKSIARKYIQLRYNLLPYNYTLAYQQAKFGKPLVQPLFYYEQADSNLFKAENEFMWGNEILVAPVLEKNATERKIYLPKGNWYNFFTDEKINGSQWINKKIDLNNIPVFVKEGSFIPMFIQNSISSTKDYTGKEITIKYYPSQNKTSYVMFDDDGHTNKTLVKGNYELIKFEGQTIGENVIIKITPDSKKIIMERRFKLVLPAFQQIMSVKINGQLSTGNVNDILFNYSGKPVDIELQLK